jgi:hypothetical protein
MNGKGVIENRSTNAIVATAAGSRSVYSPELAQCRPTSRTSYLAPVIMEASDSVANESGLRMLIPLGHGLLQRELRLP